MKKLLSIFMAVAMLLSVAVTSYAYNLNLPDTSENTGRRSDFNGTIDHYSSSTVTAGGTVIPGGECLELTRTNESGELYYQDYISGSYGAGDGGDGYLTLKLKKNVSTAGVNICTNGGGYTVMLKWAGDGKLYSMDRANALADKATRWNYICDIDGLEAKITMYIYTSKDCYAVAVNDAMVSRLLYSYDVNPTKSELFRVTVEPGAIGDKISIDYKETGYITGHTLIPGGVSTSITDYGDIAVTTEFAGYGAAALSDLKVYSAVYNHSGHEIVGVSVASVADSIVMDSAVNTFGSVTQSVNVGDANKEELFIKNFVWNDSLIPSSCAKKVYFLTPPVMTTVERVDNFDNGDLYSGGQFEFAGKEGEAFAIINEANGKANIIRNGKDGYAAITAWMAGGNNKTTGIVSFTISKSSKEATGQFRLLPCDYVAFAWNSDGSITACYRDSADQLGTDAQWHQVKKASDDLSVNVIIAFNGSDSSYSMWFNGEPVVVNKYSRALYNGQHNVPTFINQVRFYSESGNEGDTISLGNYRFGYGAGYGA